MDLICFTKLLKPFGPDQLIAFAKKNRLAGYDLTVRDGYPVTPETIGTDLVPFVRKLQDAGLVVPMATVGSRAMPPGEKATETAWAACAEAGIGQIKLGYWVWDRGGPHYWDQVKTIRKELAEYAKLAERYRIQALFHTHSGVFYGLNASSMMHLIADVDPKHVGAYLDPAHLSLDGEPLELAVDILKGRLAMVAVKNGHYQKTQDGATTIWKGGVCELHKGMVDWRQAVKILKQAGYDGHLNMHGEYDDRHDTESVIEVLEPDIAYMHANIAQL